MEISSDLRDQLTTLTNADRKQSTLELDIHQQLRIVDRPQGLKNRLYFLGRWILHLITCKHIAINPKLDLVTKKILAQVNAIDQWTTEDKDLLERAFSNLKEIVVNNAGRYTLEVEKTVLKIKKLAIVQKLAEEIRQENLSSATRMEKDTKIPSIELPNREDRRTEESKREIEEAYNRKIREIEEEGRVDFAKMNEMRQKQNAEFEKKLGKNKLEFEKLEEEEKKIKLEHIENCQRILQRTKKEVEEINKNLKNQLNT